MEQRNKIIIPTGVEPEEAPEAPHFDAEETLLAARPVVPLSQDDIESSHYARAQRMDTPLARRFPLLAMVIIAAVCAGAAGGLAVALYQSRQATQAQVAAQPPSKTAVDTRFTQKPAEETSQTQLPSVQPVPDTDKTTDEQTASSRSTDSKTDVETTKRPAMRDEEADKKQASPPLAARKKPQDERVMDEIEQKKPKPPKRRARHEEDMGDNFPRQIERANQELNRIREIFEGTQP
jgi:cytoskeletal protein RodZ